MLPKKNRLPREAFRERGYRAAATPFFSIKTKNNTLGANRIGVVIGLSVDKRATRRNFLERQVKNQLLRAPNLGKDIIVIIFPKVRELSKRQFVEEIKKSLKKV